MFVPLAFSSIMIKSISLSSYSFVRILLSQLLRILSAIASVIKPIGYETAVIKNTKMIQYSLITISVFELGSITEKQIARIHTKDRIPEIICSTSNSVVDIIAYYYLTINKPILMVLKKSSTYFFQLLPYPYHGPGI